MKGDTLLLYDVAERLGKSVSEVGEMDLPELYGWKAKFELDWNRPTRTDYYLMQIAQRVFTVLMKSDTAKQYGTEKFFIRFKEPQKKGKIPVAKALPDEEGEVKLDEEEIKRRTAMSKAYWGGIVGIKLE